MYFQHICTFIKRLYRKVHMHDLRIFVKIETYTDTDCIYNIKIHIFNLHLVFLLPLMTLKRV